LSQGPVKRKTTISVVAPSERGVKRVKILQDVFRERKNSVNIFWEAAARIRKEESAAAEQQKSFEEVILNVLHLRSFLFVIGSLRLEGWDQSLA